MFLIIGLLLAGFSYNNVKKEYEKKKLPDIVFLCQSYRHYENEYKIHLIDKQGNIYFSDNKEIVCMEYQELLEQYASGELQNEMSIIDVVPEEEVFEKYLLLKKLSYNSKFELIPDEYSLDEECPVEYWSGIYYKWGKEEFLTFYKPGNCTYRGNDELAEELFDWMRDVVPDHFNY